MYTLRELNPETDYPVLSALRDLCGAEPVSVEDFQRRDAQWSPDGVRNRIVAETEGGIVGYTTVAHVPYFRPGDFWHFLLVHPELRRRGIGSALYEAQEIFLAAHGARRIKVEVREDGKDGLTFAEKRGFQIVNQGYESALQIADFDDTPYAGLLDRLREEGLRFFSLADCLSDADGGESAKRKLYALNTESAHDIPGSDLETVRPYEQFVQDVFEASWFRADGQIAVADGHLWVGLAAVGEIAPGVMYNMHTGVRRAYRGRKIAQALKLLTIEFCRKHNAHTIRTHNNSHNTAMLAVNRKMGYIPESGMYILMKEMNETGEPDRRRDEHGDS